MTMAIVKKEWTNFVNTLGISLKFNSSNIATLIHTLDVAFQTKYGVITSTSSVYTTMLLSFFGNEQHNLWNGLPLYTSSFKQNDMRIIYSIIENLTKYTIFLTKMIDDEGIQRKLLTSKEYTHNNTSDSGDKNLYSETPQIELDNFENAIKYASNLSKSDLHNESEQTGDSTETVTSTTWDEGLRNLRFAFYNDLIDYINSIPNLIYSYYSLDSLPVPELVKANREYFKTISNL